RRQDNRPRPARRVPARSSAKPIASHMPRIVISAFSLSLCVSALPAAAQTPVASDPLNGTRRSVQAIRLADGEHITIDGALDEAVWRRTTPATDFIMQDPDLGGTPTEATEVHFAFNN